MLSWSQEPYNSFDWALITSGYVTLILYGYLLRFSSRRRTCALANTLLVVSLLVGGILFAWRVDANTYEVPWLLIQRVFEGGVVRNTMLRFWMLNVFVTLGFCVQTAYFTHNINTSHRKFFHVTVSLVAVSGFLYDTAFCILCGNLIVQMFILLEILRSNRVKPWHEPLDGCLIPFLDGQDSVALIMTPIHLIGGIFLPSLMDTLLSSRPRPDRPPLYAGVLTVGVGDALAAFIGSRYGRTPWGANGRKSVEGSVAMFFGQLVVHVFLFGWADCGFTTILIYAICVVLEASLARGDNIILPPVGYLLFKSRDCIFGL